MANEAWNQPCLHCQPPLRRVFQNEDLIYGVRLKQEEASFSPVTVAQVTDEQMEKGVEKKQPADGENKEEQY